ncbi:MAG: tetratricopeptide repeat protein, partial [bacterium]|nr:tetratricopeptide repeat protein [bacterium]
EAAQAYQKGADKYPNDFNSDQLLMNAGRCYLKANQIAEARECYQTVVEKFEDSNYKLDAELYLAKLKS